MSKDPANLKYFDAFPSVVIFPVISISEIGMQLVKSMSIGRLYPPSGTSYVEEIGSTRHLPVVSITLTGGK